MAIERDLSDVNQDDFDTAEAKLIAAIREYNPAVDLRVGTALRDLLLRQAALLNGYNEKLNEDLRNSQSLLAVSENPDLADDDVVDGILSNINVVRRAGSPATGLVIVTVPNAERFTVPEGYLFTTASGISYVTTQSYRARPEGVYTGGLDELLITPHTTDELTGSYYVLIPVTSSDIGSNTNISSGVAMTVTESLVVGVTTQESYNNFTGGADEESLTELLARVPTALGQKSMESQQSIGSVLQGEFPSIREISAVGFGFEAQLRDKHNIFGSAMGGKTDIYVRQSTDPETQTYLVQASKVEDGIYSVTLTPDIAAGIQFVRSVTSPDVITPTTPLTSQLPVIGSYPFTFSRGTAGLDDSYHDFDTNNLSVETAYSAYQSVTLIVTDIPSVVEDGQSVWPDALTLKVEVYVTKQIREIQTYVDNDLVRNLKADQVVRSFVPVMVSMTATLNEEPGESLDTDLIRQAVVDYINSKTFGDIVTVSQLDSVLHMFPIVTVKSLQLNAVTVDAANNIVQLFGPTLDINDVESPEYLLNNTTAMFAADIRDIFITTTES
jgi:uncharacterized phage protein gp47/JayE